MAAGDEEPLDESDVAPPAPTKSDVRVSEHEDMGVRVSRDLRATGPSARGYGSNMSKLSFSARGRPRDEMPEEEPAQPTPVASAPVPPSAAGSTMEAPAAPGARGALSWLTGLFSRR